LIGGEGGGVTGVVVGVAVLSCIRMDAKKKLTFGMFVLFCIFAKGKKDSKIGIIK